MRAGGAEDRPAGEVGVHAVEEFTSARLAASDEDHDQARREADGTLTAMQIHTVSNTGAYGNHGGEVLASSLGSSMATYRCANKKGTGYAVYTNTVPSGAFRGYGASQPAFAIESAIDELARKLGIDPFAFRRTNMIQARDPVHSIWPFADDGVIGSYGLDQCLDLVEQALASGRGDAKPEGDEWLEGRGVAIHGQDCAPPTEHRSESHMTLQPDGTYHLAVGAAGVRQRHPQRPAPGRGHRPERAGGARSPWTSSTPTSTPYDTGTFASTGTSVATLGVQQGRRGPAGQPARSGQRALTGVPVEQCRLDDGRVRCGDRSLSLQELHAAAPLPEKLHVSRKVYGTPRSTAFLAHGFRIAVHRVTGEIRILQSVQAFDAGKIINPMQARGRSRAASRRGSGRPCSSGW